MSTQAYDLLARVYDLQHRTFTEDVPMYLTLAAQAGSPAQVLEFGAGTGRVMIPLLEAGHGVAGVDLSRGMLDIAAQRIAESPKAKAAPSKLIEADTRSLALDEKFDLVIIALNTFLHNLTREDQLATLRAARAHLRPGGSLVVDLPPNDELANQPDDGVFDLEASLIDPASKSHIEKFVASRVFWAAQEQELKYRVEETSKGETHAQTVSFRLRHVFKHEMELLLQAAGFARWDWFGDYALAPYSDSSRRMIVQALV
ncbi:MAG TPA: methyltransferase domain-containing protein [Thermoflexales bacterium]|nr:methyltransferase domain-containing protein [Thermoflexales bacterium]HQW34911.1 methyltransferase domain-containing protein [Thermoflexales bacterium]HQX76339.1 methyltransferase domain-containing protein [Thermoflexales bacterium]HQZ99669.1 methyltransferase domain-containing protein [Thermoflexales bacterium]